MNTEFAREIASPDVETRRRAAIALADETAATALPWLDTLLGDPNWRVRKAAVETVLALPTEAVMPTLIQALYDPENAGKRNSAYESLVKAGPSVLPHVYDHLVEEDTDVKLALISLLGEVPSRNSAPHLIYYLSHDNINVVSAAITSLGRLKDAGNLPVLVDLFQRQDDWVWFHLIEALSGIGGPAATSKLIELYEHPKYRRAVLKSFGRMGDLHTVSFLLQRAADPGSPLLAVMEALGQIYNANIPEALLPRHHREVARQIQLHFPMEVLSRLETAWGEAKVTERRGMILVAGALADLSLLDKVLAELASPYLQRDAFNAALAFGRAAARTLIARLNASPAQDQRLLLIRLLAAAGGPDAVVPLLNQSYEDDVQIRMEAIAALGEVDDPRCLQKLVGVLREPDMTFHDVALRAARNLARKHPEHRARLAISGETMVSDDEETVRCAAYALLAEGRNGDAALLVPGLQDPSPVVRQAVVRIIAQGGGARTFQDLLPMLGDTAARVRRAVISALGRELLARQPEILITSLSDPDVWVRAETAFFLSQSTDPSISQSLLKALEEDELPVRLGSLRGLAEVGCGSLFKAVLALATQASSPLEVRQAALGALAKSGRPDAVRALTDAVQEHRWEIRSTAIELMGASQDRRFIPILLKELERDQDTLVRQTVIHALIALKAIEAVPRMLNYLTDPALKDATFAFFTSLGREHARLIENEAQSVDFQTKLILIEILKHLENL